MNKIHIFLASSFELKNERQEIEQWIGRKNKLLINDDTFLHLDIWEDAVSAMSKTRKQDDYNKLVEESDIFISLFATKVGKYTEEEFNHAYDNLKEGQTKYIYTFFKNFEINTLNLKIDELSNLERFKQDLKTSGHFPDYFTNSDHLIRQLESQFDKILGDIIKSKESTEEAIKNSNLEEITEIISKWKDMQTNNRNDSAIKREIVQNYDYLKSLVETSDDISKEFKRMIHIDSNYLFKLNRAESNFELRKLINILFDKKIPEIENVLKKIQNKEARTSKPNMKPQEFIKQLISENLLKRAIKELSNLVKETDIEKDVINLSRRLNDIEQRKRRGLKFDETELNEITNNLLEILEKIEEE